MKYINKKGKEYYLQRAKSPRSGSFIYFFSKKNKDNSTELPEGFEVKENIRGHPLVVREKNENENRIEKEI